MKRRAFSLAEVLIAAAVLVALGLPVLELATQNVRGLRVDRARSFADRLAWATAERFASDPAGLRAWLSGTADDPWTLRGTDLWKRAPELFNELGLADVARWSSTYGMHLNLTLTVDVAPGLDLAICEVSWNRDGGASGPRERVTHVRAHLSPHTH